MKRLKSSSYTKGCPESESVPHISCSCLCSTALTLTAVCKAGLSRERPSEDRGPGQQLLLDIFPSSIFILFMFLPLSVALTISSGVNPFLALSLMLLIITYTPFLLFALLNVQFHPRGCHIPQLLKVWFLHILLSPSSQINAIYPNSCFRSLLPNSTLAD